MGGSYEEYLQSLRGTTRRGLKRSRKKFLAKAGEEFAVRRFESPDDVTPFLHHATTISKKTYQWRLLGLGMRDVASRNAKYTYAAENGWFRSYILYAGGEPIAFASGYLHNRTYYGHELGGDPDWRPSHAGVFLLTEIIQDLFDDTAPVEIYDFLYGDDLLKSRLANTERTERHFYLFPRGFHGALMAYPLRAVNALSAAASFVLNRLRLKEYIKRLRRDRSVKGKQAE
jgi:CelD/BcsL family acetyltransferase involved in cellulose biosynthesis